MQKRYIHTATLKFVNTILMCIPFILCWFLYYESKTMTANSKQSSVLFLFCYICGYYILCNRLDGYRYSLHRVGELIFSQIIAAGVTDAISILVIWMQSIHFPYLWPIIECFLLQALITFPASLISYKYFFKHHEPYKSIVIYDVRQGMEELVTTYGLHKRFDIQKTCAIEDVLFNIEDIDNYEAVLMSGVHSHDRNIILKRCIEKNIVVYMIPRVGDVVMSGAEKMHMLSLPILRSKRYDPSSEFKIIKRVFDIAISSIFLVLLSPLFLIITLLVRSDGGPAFYKQTRLTKDGEEFKILKFRSMRVDAEKKSGAVLSSGENDPRITHVGRFIRACRIDELPQLVNILRGEMSFVGPRPERPEIAAEYEKEMPEFRLRLQAKAGLTGYAQVFGKYNTTPYDKLLMDLMYISNPSILEDLLIMLSTVKILFLKDSTEGIAVGATNAQDDSYNPNRRKNN